MDRKLYVPIDHGKVTGDDIMKLVEKIKEGLQEPREVCLREFKVYDRVYSKSIDFVQLEGSGAHPFCSVNFDKLILFDEKALLITLVLQKLFAGEIIFKENTSGEDRAVENT